MLQGGRSSSCLDYNGVEADLLGFVANCRAKCLEIGGLDAGGP